MCNCKEKIAIVIDNAFGAGGTERVLSNMSLMLSDKYDIDIYSISSGRDAFYDFGTSNIISNKKGYLRSLFFVIKEINNKKYKAVFLITMGRLSCLFGLLSLLISTGGNKIYSCEHVSYESYPFYVRFLKCLTSFLYDGIVVLTDSNSTWIKRRSNTKVYVIPNEAPYIEMNKKFVLRKKAIFVGRLAKQKRVDLLLEYWKLFKEKDRHNWQLEIIGDGKNRDTLEDISNTLGLSSSVFFKGHQSDMEKVYNEANILLMTSEYEGFPMVLLEAQAYGLPCIALDCPTGPKEIIENGKSGFVVQSKKDFVECLYKISSDEILLEKMSLASLENIKRFSHSEIRDKWLEIIG